MLKYTYTILVLLLIGLNSCRIFKEVENKQSRDKAETVKEIEEAKIDTVEYTKSQIKDVDDSVLDSINSEPTEELVIDSTAIVQQMFSDTAAFIRVFKNRFGENSHIYENTSMQKGSALMHQLDSLTTVKYFNKYEFVTDVSKLNKYGYAINEVPTFSDSIYELRIAMLNLQTPIELIYNEHVKGFINVYAKRGRNQTARMLGMAEIYFPLFEQVLDKYNMPLELKYLAVVESALNPTAGSRAGAKGLWQFMYSTGKRYGLTSNSLVDDRFDPYKATEAAVRHLKDLYNIYHSWELALAAYNSGPGNVNRAIRRAGGVKNYWAIWPFLPRETRGYVPAFIAVNYVFSYSVEHNIYPTHPGILADGIDSITVRDVLSFDQISEFMHIDKDDLSFLNPSYKQGIIPATNGKTYILRLPREKIGFFIENENSIYNFKSKAGIEREKLLVKIKKAQERSIYIVRSGDNLGSIARRHRTTVRRLKSWNGLRSTRIHPGQKLVVYASDNSSRKYSSKSKKKIKNAHSYHKVRKGETLGHIAQQNGISVSQLRQWNNIRGNMIKPGQKLIVSSKPYKKTKVLKTNGKYKYHIIKSGDTLWDLSRKYDSSVDEIKQWNGITNSYRLKLGEKLIVGQG